MTNRHHDDSNIIVVIQRYAKKKTKVAKYNTLDMGIGVDVLQ